MKFMKNYTFEAVYESLTGQALKSCQIPGIENAFAQGAYCAELYEEVYNVNIRLCKRLGNNEEDKDVETIINNMMLIQRELCFQMYCLCANLKTQTKKPIHVKVRIKK